MLPAVYDALRCVRAACRIRAQWKSRALPIILLAAALDFAVASGANGAEILPSTPPGSFVPNPAGLSGPPFGLPPTQGTPAAGITVFGGVTINANGNVFNATGNNPNPAGSTTLTIGNGTGGPINITTTPVGTPPASALVVNGGGTGQPGGNNSTSSAIAVNVTGSDSSPVTLTSSGHSVVWLVGTNASLTANGNGSPANVVFTGNGTPVNFGVSGQAAQEATAVTVQNGATATLTDVILNVGGDPGFLPASKMALCVGGCGETGDFGANRGGTATLTDVLIDVTSDNSAGIWDSRISNVNVTGGSITVTGDNGQGVHADANGSMTLTNVPITMGGANSLGVFAFTTSVNNLFGGTPTAIVKIDGGSILTTGPNSTGAMASGADNHGTAATVMLNGTEITTTGAGSNGLAVCNCGVTTSVGTNNNGVIPVQVGGTIIATNTDITTMGLNSFGAFAQDQGSIILNPVSGSSTITIEKDGGAGYFANNGTISATNVAALTEGVNSPGGILSNGGNLTIIGGTVMTTGTGSFGFLVTPVTPDLFVAKVNVGNPGVSAGDPTAVNTLTINEAKVTSAADAFRVTGAVPDAPGVNVNVVADINVNGSTITGENGVLLNTLNGGTTNLTDTGSTLTGAILTDFATSTAHVSLTSDTWNMSLSSNMTSLAENGSTINFAPPAAGADVTQLSSYKTLTTNIFTGSAGLINMNTFVGADSSPSDRIVITALNGQAGTAQLASETATPVSLFFHPTGGLGQGTTANGILVVEADEKGGTTQPEMFVMGNSELRPGALDYRLFRGGLNPSNSPNDWFLRATFVAPPPPTGPTEMPEELVPPPPTIPGEPPITVLPSTPPPTPLPPDVLFPIIGPELATYGVVQPLARQLGLSILGTLDDRVGDTYEPDAVAPAVPAPEGPAVELPTKKPTALPTKKPGPMLAPRPLFSPSVWGRFFGQTIDNRYGAFADPHASGNLGGFQGGIDLLRGSLISGHYERMGLYGAYGDVSADVDGLVTNAATTGYVNTHTGSMSLTAWSGGAYWTHIGPGGWYLDTVLQGTSYSGSASTADARLNTDGWGFIASLEGGVPFAFPQLGPGFVLEPQGQILWQKVSFHHDYDGLGDVALGDTTGPSGRIGLRTKWTIVTAGGQVWQPYLRGNLWRDWGAEADAVYSGTSIVPLVNQATMLEFGGGLTGRLNANVSVFANVDYEFAVGSGDDKRNGVRGAFGARYTW